MIKPIRALAAVVAMLAVAGCQESKTTSDTASTTATTTPPATTPPAATGGAAGTAQEVTMPNGLKYQDLKVGDGTLAESGSSVSVHYTGWLTDGTKFDSSVDRGQPFNFRLGAGQVIRGWDEGVKGMRVGGKRKLTIPPDLGYGSRGAGGAIGPNETLVFVVDAVSIR